MRATSRGEDGLTLIETMISLFVLAIVMAGFVQVLASSLSTDAQSRQRQAASQLATEVIETLRDAPPQQVAHFRDPDPLVVDAAEFDSAAFSVCDSGSGTVDGAPVGVADACERLLYQSGGVVRNESPYIGPAVPNLVVTTFVTDASSEAAGARRVTVVVQSVSPAPPATFTRSAIFSEVSRG
jgi:type II secretory pathway pseudopilin PulG